MGQFNDGPGFTFRVKGPFIGPFLAFLACLAGKCRFQVELHHETAEQKANRIVSEAFGT
jgi:hypothetical protein